MVLSNTRDDLEGLRNAIETNYEKRHRSISIIFLTPTPDIHNEGWFSWAFLIDRKYVIQYSIGPSDRGAGYLGGLSLAIGPHYFGPADFWSYENSERFRMGTDTFDIEQNLRLLDEFFGIAPASPPL